jgi:hypothetical protein
MDLPKSSQVSIEDLAAKNCSGHTYMTNSLGDGEPDREYAFDNCL